MKINLEKYIYNPSSFFTAKTLVALFFRVLVQKKIWIKMLPGEKPEGKVENGGADDRILVWLAR